MIWTAWLIFRGSMALQIAVAAALAWAALGANNLYQRNKGAQAIVVKINEQAERTSAKAEKARTRADGVADPVAELRKRTCSSC